MSKINTTLLANILKDITKSTMCSITYLVDDTRSRTVNGKKLVQKRVYVSHVALNHNYQNKVNNLNETDTFVALPLKGKTRVSSTLLMSDKTNALMIDGKVLFSEAAQVLGYFHEGNEITEKQGEEMGLWAGAYYTPAPVKTMGRGTVSEEDNFYIINTYLTKIEKIKLQGNEYEVETEAVQEIAEVA
jgi:hypothetical protein